MKMGNLRRLKINGSVFEDFMKLTKELLMEVGVCEDGTKILEIPFFEK